MSFKSLALLLLAPHWTFSTFAKKLFKVIVLLISLSGLHFCGNVTPCIDGFNWERIRSHFKINHLSDFIINKREVISYLFFLCGLVSNDPRASMLEKTVSTATVTLAQYGHFNCEHISMLIDEHRSEGSQSVSSSASVQSARPL